MKMEPITGLLCICENRRWVRIVSDGERRRRAMARQPIARPGIEITAPDGIPRLPDERHEEMYIVQGEEAEPQDLLRHEEMPDVRSAEAGARGAIALRVKGVRIGAELRALDVQSPVPGESGPVPPHARWRDAVEEVHAAANPLDQIFGEADSHQVARVSPGKRLVDYLEHLVHCVLFFPHREAADAESCPVVHPADCGGCLTAQMGVDSTLDDWKERLLISWIIQRELLARRFFIERLPTLQSHHLGQAS